MKNLKYVLIIALILLDVLSQALPTSAQSNPVHGHLLDTQWYGLNDNYTSIEVTITPEVGDSDYYYFANDVYFHNCSGSECVAYGGLQTNGFDGQKWIGKMAIFSLWNATQSIAEPGGTSVNFGGEGVGQSVRIPYNWQIGTSYRFVIYLDTDGSSKLWGARITNLSNGQTTRIGWVYAPAGYGFIYGPITFHERYGGPTATCQTVPASQVRFSNMTANGGTIKSSSWNHYYRAPLTDCTNFWIKDFGDGFSSAIGTSPPSTPATTQPPQTTQPKPTGTTPSQQTKTPTKTSPTKAVTEPKTQNSSYAKPTPHKNKLLPVFWLIPLAGLLLIFSYMGNKRRIKQFKKYIFHDFDVHGPKH